MRALVRPLVRPIKRQIKRMFGIGEPPSSVRPAPADYWETRKSFRYFQDVIVLAAKHAPDAQSVIDVGPRDTPFILQFDRIPFKTAIDLAYAPRIPNCTNIQGDFLTYRPERPFDLVLCLQVLEHLDDPRTFAQKLLSTGRTVIISVPYRWPRGFCKYHVQDPIDEDKFLGWTGRPFLEKEIVTDEGHQRIIGVFEGDARSEPPPPGAPG